MGNHQRRRIGLAGLGVAIAVAGALPASCGGGGGGGELALMDFCLELADAACRTADSCGCLAAGTTVEGCRMAYTCRLMPGSLLRGQIDEGQVTYDPAAAAAYVERVRDASCDAAAYVRGATQQEQVTMFGTIEGTIDPGGACLMTPPPSGCRGGRCEGDTCAARVGQGDPCDATHLCGVSLDSDPASRLRCVGGTCQPLAGLGESCTATEDCIVGHCFSGTCNEGLPDGQACMDDPECMSGRCDFSTGRCDALEENGGLCTEHLECQSGWCADRLDIGAGHCMAPQADDATCAEPQGCQSGACVAGVCKPLICALIL